MTNVTYFRGGRHTSGCVWLVAAGSNELYCTRKMPDMAKRAVETSLFEKLFEFSPDAIVVTDQTGKISEVNAQVEKFFGYSRSELLGQPVELLIPERFRGIHPKHREEYVAQPHVRAMGAGLELYGRRKDGSEFPVDIMLGPVEGAEGTVVLCVIRDLSQKKRDEEALRRGELRDAISKGS